MKLLIKYVANSGTKNSPLRIIKYCPSCGKPQHQTVTQSVVVTQNKNPGTAVLTALIAEFFGFQKLAICASR